MNTTDRNIEIAERAIEDLELLRANSGGPTEVASIAQLVAVPSGNVLDSEKRNNDRRAEAWLAICSVCVALDKNPRRPEIHALWDRAIGATKHWREGLQT